MTENGMDFQSNPPTLPNLEENLLSCEPFEPPGMDLEEGPQCASDYELNSSISHQLSSHFSTLSFVTPDMSSSVGTTQPCGADDAFWYLTQQDGVFRATAPELNTSNLIHLNTTNDSAAALCPGVYEESSRMMGDGETPECDQSWRDGRAGSPGALQVFEQGHSVFGRVQQRDLMSMDLDEQPEGRKSQTSPTWPLTMEDDHLHIKELLTQLHTHHPGSSNDTDSVPVLEQPSKANPDFAARPGLDAMEEKDTQDVHIKLELQSDCPPCPLHIATGRGMVLQERRGQQPVYVQEDAENTSQRGLLFAEADREDLLNLLRYQRVTPTDLGHGTPLARSEALVGTTVDVFSQKGILEQDGCGVVELPSHYPCSQEAGCGCTTTGLEKLVVGTESTQEWPETEEATKDSVCMSPSSPDQCPMTARVRIPSQPAPEELPSNNMVESVSFYPALKEVPGPCEPEDLLDGVIFGAKYLGSTQLTSERNPSTSTRMRQAQEAVDRIKAPDGESQPMTEVDLFVSTKRIKVLTADSQEAMMDHPLQTISYIADIGSIVVLMARRKLPRKAEESVGEKRLYKMICHVFHSADAQVIAQAIGQAFSVAYQQFLHSSGIDPSKLTPDEFSDVLSKEELYNGDLVHFSKQENCKEICIQKQKGDILGVAIVESGWGSILPTVVIANLMHGGPAEKSGELSIGDRIMSINGTSLVGLPLATCQNIIRDLRPLRDVTLSIVHCPPVTTAIIRRPDSKHQLGFCVEDGIICSLMRGGIAERGGIRVGHRIIEINDQSVVATPHEKIIQTLMNAVGEVHIKTMPASTYRLLTGQEQPIYL